MTSLPIKLKLGKLIKSSLQTAGLRQLDLAEYLQISTAAVSQMLNGQTTPKPANLDKIFKFLNCNSNQIFMMRDLFAKIRSGMYELRSPFNDFLRNARKEQGLSQSKLAISSNISIAELRLLENCSTFVPSKEQVIALAEVLKFDIKDMYKLINELPQQIDDDRNIRKSSIQIPVLSLEDIIKFNPMLEDIENFIRRNQDQASLLHLDGSINNNFAIVASGDNFQPPFPGSVRLIVAVKDLPKIDDVVIVKFKNNNKLQLKRFVSEEDNIYLMPFNDISDKQVAKADNIEWLRKVSKVVINICE
jgi:transcriptional regulator with XRE-family HTH domain